MSDAPVSTATASVAGRPNVALRRERINVGTAKEREVVGGVHVIAGGSGMSGVGSSWSGLGPDDADKERCDRTGETPPAPWGKRIIDGQTKAQRRVQAEIAKRGGSVEGPAVAAAPVAKSKLFTQLEAFEGDPAMQMEVLKRHHADQAKAAAPAPEAVVEKPVIAKAAKVA